MCIVCRAGDEGLRFLDEFAAAQTAMRQATAALHACLARVRDPIARRNYDRAHKHLVRLTREWNAIEHARELSWDDTGGLRGTPPEP